MWSPKRINKAYGAPCMHACKGEAQASVPSVSVRAEEQLYNGRTRTTAGVA